MDRDMERSTGTSQSGLSQASSDGLSGLSDMLLDIDITSDIRSDGKEVSRRGSFSSIDDTKEARRRGGHSSIDEAMLAIHTEKSRQEHQEGQQQGDVPPQWPGSDMDFRKQNFWGRWGGVKKGGIRRRKRKHPRRSGQVQVHDVLVQQQQQGMPRTADAVDALTSAMYPTDTEGDEEEPLSLTFDQGGFGSVCVDVKVSVPETSVTLNPAVQMPSEATIPMALRVGMTGPVTGPFAPSRQAFKPEEPEVATSKRGGYRCGRCGQKKNGHVCLAAPDTIVVRSVFTQCDLRLTA